MHREKQRLHGLGLILSLPVPPVTSSQPLSVLPRHWDPGWTLGQPERACFLQDCTQCPCSAAERRGGQSEACQDPRSIRGGEGSWKAGEAPSAGSEPQAEAWGPGSGFVPRAPRTLLRGWCSPHPRPRGRTPPAPACRRLGQPGLQVRLLSPFDHKRPRRGLHCITKPRAFL